MVGLMMRFNHMELTFAPGTLTPEFRDRIRTFYGGVFGWECKDTEILGQSAGLSHCITLHHITSHHLTSHHITSHDNISHHIT